MTTHQQSRTTSTASATQDTVAAPDSAAPDSAALLSEIGARPIPAAIACAPSAPPPPSTRSASSSRARSARCSLWTWPARRTR